MATYQVHMGMTKQQQDNYKDEFKCYNPRGHEKYDLLYEYFNVIRKKAKVNDVKQVTGI